VGSGKFGEGSVAPNCGEKDELWSRNLKSGGNCNFNTFMQIRKGPSEVQVDYPE
jgi:hypothetical protein